MFGSFSYSVEIVNMLIYCTVTINGIMLERKDTRYIYNDECYIWTWFDEFDTAIYTRSYMIVTYAFGLDICLDKCAIYKYNIIYS
jgi:hypothetical protein